MKSFTAFLMILLALQACSPKQQKTIGTLERIDPALDAVVDVDARPEIIAEGFEWSEGPLWVEAHRMLLFSDVPKNTVHKWTEEKGLETYLQPSGYTGQIQRGGETGSNGLLLNNKGQLVLCQHGDRRLALMNAPLDAPAPDFISLADNYQGKKFDSPNDVAQRNNGDYYFTDPPYGLEKYIEDPAKAAPYQGVYRVKGDGTVSLLVDTLTRPNGIAFMPGDSTLLVANSDGEKPIWYAFDISSTDSLQRPRVFYDATVDAQKDKGGPDGLKTDRNGNVFATGPGGVWIFDKNARVLGKIRLPVPASNCALADNEKTLFITADMYVLRVRLRK